jgi:hypothetical protein
MSAAFSETSSCAAVDLDEERTSVVRPIEAATRRVAKEDLTDLMDTPLPAASYRRSGVRPVTPQPLIEPRAPSRVSDVAPQGSVAPAPDRPTDFGPGMLHGDELSRAQMMLRVVAVVAALASVTLAFGMTSANATVPPIIDLLVTTMLVALLGTAVSLGVLAKLFGSISRWQHLLVGLLATTALLLLLAKLGPSSAVVAALLVAVQYYASTGRWRETWTSYVLASGGLVVVASLVSLGVLPWLSATVTMWIMVVVIELCLAAILCSSCQRALSQRERDGRARMSIGRREALLDEAYATVAALQPTRQGRLSGKIVDGYQLQGLIGVGASAEIYRVRRANGEPAAVKVFDRGAARVAACFRVASAASAMSPGVVRVFGHGVMEDGSPYLAMELVEGRDLASLLRDPWRLGRPETMRMLDQLASTLEAAHRGRMVHGDLDPKRIIRTNEGRWKLLGFGDIVFPPRCNTAGGSAVLPPRYTAPELMAGVQFDARADVFALGALAYRVLTQCPPLCVDDPFETGCRARPTRPSSIADVHQDVDRVLALALALDPAARFDSVRAFAEALREATEGRLAPWLRLRGDEVIASEPWALPLTMMMTRSPLSS